MADLIDVETGEISAALPRMPPEIAGAIIKIMKGTKQLGFDERNAHGGYNYVSVDKFLDHFRPLCADADLLVVIDEPEIGYRDVPNKDGKVTSWLMATYDVWLYHASGSAWGPLRRHLALPMTGPQTFGSGESYVQKRLLRGLFMVPTGEKDADDTPAGDIGASPPRAYPPRNGASKVNPAVAQPADDTAVARIALVSIRDAIKAAGSTQQCHAIFDPVLNQWGGDYAAGVAEIAKVSPDSVDDLKSRVRTRILALSSADTTAAAE